MKARLACQLYFWYSSKYLNLSLKLPKYIPSLDKVSSNILQLAHSLSDHPCIARYFQKSNLRISRAAHFAIIKITILFVFSGFQF